MTAWSAARWLASLAMALLLGACTASAPTRASAEAPARVVFHPAFPSAYVSARRVTVWLPPGYDGGTERYAVLYMHDGQNLLDPNSAMGHHAWEVDRHLSALLREGRIQKTLVVGIDNSDTRWQDYAPEAPFQALSPELRTLAIGKQAGPPHSDNYLRFLVEELKPFIDAHYRTRTDRAHTFVMGSSMGGLISVYALARRPDVFGGAACLSTHWPYTTNYEALSVPGNPQITEIAAAVSGWLGDHVPSGIDHRVYFDHGTETVDGLYAPFQQRVDALFLAHDYRDGENFETRVYPGAAHNEESWSARLAEPLAFLLRP